MITAEQRREYRELRAKLDEIVDAMNAILVATGRPYRASLGFSYLPGFEPEPDPYEVLLDGPVDDEGFPARSVLGREREPEEDA